MGGSALRGNKKFRQVHKMTFRYGMLLLFRYKAMLDILQNLWCIAWNENKASALIPQNDFLLVDINFGKEHNQVSTAITSRLVTVGVLMFR